MYVGRIIAVGRNRAGHNAVMYRVSSRSFPNRMAVDNGGTLAVVPRPGHEGDVRQNPYLAYNALRLAGSWAIAGQRCAHRPRSPRRSAPACRSGTRWRSRC